MDYELRIVVEKVAIGSQKVVRRETIKIYDIQCPQSIIDLGLRHLEQISLLEKVQNALLAEQSVLIDPGMNVCPNCGRKLKKNGAKESDFHAVFSDHRLAIQKYRCNHPECGWQSASTIKSIFGTSIHPDLAKLQCEQGALFSYREAESNLERLNCQSRSINNHNQVKRITDNVGAVLAEQNAIRPVEQECAASASELIVQVDGGHIPIQNPEKRSFEALSAIVYRPESIQEVDSYHRQIIDKSCVFSAKDNNLHSIKTFLINALLKQGLSKDTKVIGLADGANNCWSVLSIIKPECATLECILDWFHIGKKFQNVKNALGEAFETLLDSAKWKLWHGQTKDALTKLALLHDNVTDESKKSKLTGLYDYLHRNQAYLVNYDARDRANQIYTSQVAESHIDSLINARHKRTKKMQWTREGAHYVLQIRAMIASGDWERNCQGAVLAGLKATA
ncbi:MAG: ISKra4 family transposase [Gloeobacterales cyanobacterium]